MTRQRPLVRMPSTDSSLRGRPNAPYGFLAVPLKPFQPGYAVMKLLWTTVMLMGLCGQTAQAVQTCPAGNPRIAPDSRYIDNGNSTVIDNQTGLMWKQCSEGQSGAGCSGSATTMVWSDALAAGANSSFAGFNDWRLPNVKELRSLVESGCINPAINELRFPNTLAGNYWTSSTNAAIASRAWYVHFDVGGANREPKSGNYGVRLVRGGQ